MENHLNETVSRGGTSPWGDDGHYGNYYIELQRADGSAGGTLYILDSGDSSKFKQVIPTPSHGFRPYLAHFCPVFFPFFARFHRLDEAVPTSPKSDPRAKKQPAREPRGEHQHSDGAGAAPARR